MKNLHLTALICFTLAAIFFYAIPSPEYGAGFALVGMFFELAAWKKFLRRDPK